MKSFHTAKGLLMIIIFLTGINACKKESDIITSIDQLTIGSYLKLEDAGKRTMNFSLINTESVSTTVSSYGEDVDSVIVYASTNNTTTLSTWRRVKAFKTDNKQITLSVTAAEIAAALGKATSALTPGTQVVLFNEVVTKTGRRFAIQNTYSEFESSADINSVFRWTVSVVCPYTGGMAGSYKVMTDSWGDWSAGDIVEVTQGSGTNQLNLNKVWPNPLYGNSIGDLIVTISNTATGAATVAAGQTFATYIDSPPYNASVGPTAGSGFVFSCTGIIDLKIPLTVTVYGNQGTKTLILQKI